MAHAQLKRVTHRYRGRRPIRSVRAAQPTVAPMPMAEATHSARIVSAEVAFSVLCSADHVGDRDGVAGGLGHAQTDAPRDVAPVVLDDLLDRVRHDRAGISDLLEDR